MFTRARPADRDLANLRLPGRLGGQIDIMAGKAYSEVVERGKTFHPEALEKGIETPKNLEPFVLPADAEHLLCPPEYRISIMTGSASASL